MLKKITAAILSLSLACLMGTSIAIATATPAAAITTGQAVLACAANLKCTDHVVEESGDHVMCVKGGGCVLCPPATQGKCDVALRAHEKLLTTDPTKILMSQSPSPVVTPKRPVTSGFAVDTGHMTMGKSGAPPQTPPHKSVTSPDRAPQPGGMSPN